MFRHYHRSETGLAGGGGHIFKDELYDGYAKLVNKYCYGGFVILINQIARSEDGGGELAKQRSAKPSHPAASRQLLPFPQ